MCNHTFASVPCAYALWFFFGLFGAHVSTPVPFGTRKVVLRDTWAVSLPLLRILPDDRLHVATRRPCSENNGGCGSSDGVLFMQLRAARSCGRGRVQHLGCRGLPSCLAVCLCSCRHSHGSVAPLP